MRGDDVSKNLKGVQLPLTEALQIACSILKNRNFQVGLAVKNLFSFFIFLQSLFYTIVELLF